MGSIHYCSKMSVKNRIKATGRPGMPGKEKARKDGSSSRAVDGFEERMD